MLHDSKKTMIKYAVAIGSALVLIWVMLFGNAQVNTPQDSPRCEGTTLIYHSAEGDRVSEENSDQCTGEAGRP